MVADQSRVPGAQTLARGLVALKLVARAVDGLTAQELGERLGVHRTIAHRILRALEEAGFVARGDDGRYRGGAGLLALAPAAHQAFRVAALPVLQRLATELESAVALLVREGAEAVAIAVAAPDSARYRLVFPEGSRHPIDRAAGGHALMMLRPPSDADTPAVVRARQLGFARTYAEVEPGAYGVAVPVRARLECALNLITYRAELADAAPERMRAGAEALVAVAPPE